MTQSLRMADQDDAVSAAIIAILAEQALISPHEVEMEATLEGLGLDSLGLVEAVFAIEERFDITVPFQPQDPSLHAEFHNASVRALIAEVNRLIAARIG